MSAIDGRTVQYRDKPNWVGLVLGDSYGPGFVRVRWDEPTQQIGIHRVVDLQILDEPPSQEELARKYYGVEDRETPEA